MKKNSTNVYIALIVVISLVCLQLPAFAAIAIPEPPAGVYVSDNADVLSAELEDKIIAAGGALYESGGAQVVLVTIDFTDGATLEDYAHEILNSWGVGSAERKDGLVIVMAIGQEDYYAALGTGTEKLLSAGKLQTILDDYMEPDFATGDYAFAAEKTYAALIEHFGGSMSSAGQSQGNAGSESGFTDYVSDNAGVLSQKTIDFITQTSRKNKESSGSALYVQTVETTDGAGIESHVRALFEDCGADGGDVCLLLAISDDDYIALQGEYVERIITNDVLNSIFELRLEPDFAARNYDSGVYATASALYDFVNKNSSNIYSAYTSGISANSGTGNPPASQNNSRESGFSIWPFISVIIIIVVAVIIINAAVNSGRRRRTYYDPGMPPVGPSVGGPYAPRHSGGGWFWGYLFGRNVGRRRYRRPPRYGAPPPPPGSPPPPPRQSPPSGGSGSRGGASSSGGARRPTSGWGGSGSNRSGSGFGGGASRGGGAGRSGFGGGSGRSSGGFGGGRSSGGGRSGGGFGGGSSRGGGAGRGRK